MEIKAAFAVVSYPSETVGLIRVITVPYKGNTDHDSYSFY